MEELYKNLIVAKINTDELKNNIVVIPGIMVYLLEVKMSLFSGHCSQYSHAFRGP